MTTLEQAARQALEALENTHDVGCKQTQNAITALRQALENHESAYQRGYLDGMAKPCIDCADRKLQAFKQPKQEPVRDPLADEQAQETELKQLRERVQKLEGRCDDLAADKGTYFRL